MMPGHTLPATRRDRHGRPLTAGAVAALLEEDTSPDWCSLLDVERSSRRAAAYGLRGVTCVPERVAAVRSFLPDAQRVTAHLESTEPLRDWCSFQLLLAQAEDAVADGADQVRVTAALDDLDRRHLRTVVSRLETLRDLTRAATADLRLHLVGLTQERVDDVVAVAAHVGLDSLEVGGTRPDTRVLARLAGTLPDTLELKLTTPMADLDRLLLTYAAGVDTFGADPATVMAAARAREERGTLAVPDAPAADEGAAAG
ncbi:hypothetical protein [Phycicoccus sp. DTK01]|uniref:hypothetical protein n=1 Tax=Phycicoccus sp. DTK01 TaxID=2785745 RepID=UPI001A8C9D40|nr:hypothetical protein [Phycicoccus sp. DTK01]GIL37026.1 hypothetical protein PDTK01_31010 [Phycicoccus sp. DTK01]